LAGYILEDLDMHEGEIRQAAQMFALVAEMHSINASIEGMKSENTTRESQGYAMAYDDAAFNSCCKELEVIAKRLREEI